MYREWLHSPPPLSTIAENQSSSFRVLNKSKTQQLFEETLEQFRELECVKRSNVGIDIDETNDAATDNRHGKLHDVSLE